MENFSERINYKGKLQDIAAIVVERYSFGKPLSCKLVLAGYEDFNFVLETAKGKYFVKVFASFRTEQECLRYVEVMVRAGQEGISTPKLLQAGGQYLCSSVVKGTPLRLCAMEYIDGDTYMILRKNLIHRRFNFLRGRQSA